MTAYPESFGKVAVLMGGRAGLGDAMRLVRAGALGRPIERALVGGDM